MTTFWVTTGSRRTWLTVPLKGSSGKESTVNWPFSPARTWPMSASSMAASTFIFVRSWAMTNSVGVLKEAATVWPTSTARLTTTPLTGALIVQ